jgi:hypothetical protein
MADVKDILGVPRGGGGDVKADSAPAKAKPERMKRPEGMSREAFALLGGSNPVIPSHLLEGLKKKDKAAKPKASTKGTVIYRYQPFRNQAREDGLELRHWAKGYKDANGRIRDAHDGDYPFAKYNKKVRARLATRCSALRCAVLCCAQRARTIMLPILPSTLPPNLPHPQTPTPTIPTTTLRFVITTHPPRSGRVIPL